MFELYSSASAARALASMVAADSANALPTGRQKRRVSKAVRARWDRCRTGFIRAIIFTPPAESIGLSSYPPPTRVRDSHPRAKRHWARVFARSVEFPVKQSGSKWRLFELPLSSQAQEHLSGGNYSCFAARD